MRTSGTCEGCGNIVERTTVSHDNCPDGQMSIPAPQFTWQSADPPLSRRDHFAMAAMQGLLAHPGDWGGGSTTTREEECVKESLAYADALIAELDK